MAQQSIELILFRQLAMSLAIPVFLIDERGDLVYLNEAAEGLLGVRLDEMDELHFDEWTTGFQQRTAEGAPMPVDRQPLVQAVQQRRPAHGAMLITGADGQERTLEVTAFPLVGGRGRLIGAVAMFWERDEQAT